MTKHSAELFPDGYSYSAGDLDCRFHRDPQTGLWVVQITDPNRREPVFTTSALQCRFAAYAAAQAWCAAQLCAESYGMKSPVAVRSKAYRRGVDDV